MNPAGMNPAGMNPAGMNSAGMNPAGMNPAGMNPAGMNIDTPAPRRTGAKTVATSAEANGTALPDFRTAGMNGPKPPPDPIKPTTGMTPRNPAL